MIKHLRIDVIRRGHQKLIFLLCSAILAMACQSKPKVIAPVTTTENQEMTQIDVPNQEAHQVVVEDFLHASRYTYLEVTEDAHTFWIAIPRTEVTKGEIYYYRGGVKMHNFHSKEHDRVFETLYLVSGVSTSPNVMDGGHGMPHQSKDERPNIELKDIEPIEGAISLDELFSDPEQYAGREISVTGQCVKVNRNIMGKNWIHLQDGSKDEKDQHFDLTVVTKEDVLVGAVVSFTGMIATNKDFGSGYRYDLIMEDAEINHVN